MKKRAHQSKVFLSALLLSIFLCGYAVAQQACTGSLLFDNANNTRVNLPATNQYYSGANGGYTWECWFKLNSAPGSINYDRQLISSIDNTFYEDMLLGFGWHGGVKNVGYDSLVFKVDGPSSAYPVDPNCAWAPAGGFLVGQWYHVAGVADYNAGMKYLYVNCQLVDAQPLTVQPNTRVIPTNLSACSACPGLSSIDGYMDEVRIWDRPLNGNELYTYCNQCLTGSEPNLFLYYRCNQAGATSVLDATANANNGSFPNPPSPGWATDNAPIQGAACDDACKCLGSLNFDAQINPSVKLPLTNRYYTDVNGGYTWECWFKLATAAGSTNNDRQLISSIDNTIYEDMLLGFGWHGGVKNVGYDSLVFKVDGPSSWFPVDANCAWAPAGGFVVNQWYHAAGVADYGAGRKYLYVNGALVATQPLTVPVNTRKIPTNLSACSGCTGANSLNGKMDEVRIWDRPLSGTEIASYYQKCRAGNEPNLVMYDRCNQVGASFVLDGSVNGFNGSFVNAPGWSTENAPVTGTCRKDCNKGDEGPQNVRKSTGIQVQTNADGSLKIYPNPTSGSIKIAAAQPGVLTVYAITGETLSKIQVQQGEQEVKLEGYKAGVYLYVFTSGTTTSSGKLIVE